MDDEKRKSLEGWAPETGNETALRAALEKAFDYRGDVTCELVGGEVLVGYLFNRDFDRHPATVEIYPAKDGQPPRKLELAQIRSVRFTGRDMADGRSWEAWMAKWEEGKAADSAGQAEA